MWLVELEQSSLVSKVKGKVRHYNHLKKAGAYKGRNVGDKDEDNSPKNINTYILVCVCLSGCARTRLSVGERRYTSERTFFLCMSVMKNI